MGKPKSARRRDRGSIREADDALVHAVPRIQASRKPFEPKTPAQGRYASIIDSNDLIFCRGPMGTGKTHVPVWQAADALAKRKIEKIIVSRPAVEAEESYGALPGELQDKWDPFFKPVKEILVKRLGEGAVEMFRKNGKIEIAPLGFLRGNTFENCWVLFDEAQNATPGQMKLFLTRIGENCKVIVDGDPDEQKDVSGLSGFEDAWRRLKGLDGVGYMTFEFDDIMRSGLSKAILGRYRSTNDNYEGEVGREELRKAIGG